MWAFFHKICAYSFPHETWKTNLTIIELAMRLAGWLCVCKSTPRTADVTEIAGYVRVRILMNRCFFFRIFAIHSFKFLTRRVHMHLHAHSYAAPTSCARVRSVAIGWRVPKASKQCWGCHCGPGATQLK